MDWQANTDAASGAPVVMETARHIVCGPLSALIVDGAVRRLTYQDVEVVRGIDCPIRDANWGTAIAENARQELSRDDGNAIYRRRFSAFSGALNVLFQARFGTDSVRLDLRLTAERPVQTNRAGFTLLHPLDGVAGCQMTITHSDGSVEQTMFPLAIAAGQPAFDIAGLKHTVHGVSVDIAFAGEIFEMEDQRNWTDASFKTYCRPLGLPFPYTIEAAKTVNQSIEIRLSGNAARAPSAGVSGAPQSAMPQVAMAATPAWVSDAGQCVVDHLPPVTPLVRVDMSHDDPAAAARATAKLGSPIELELVVDDDGEIDQPLAELAHLMDGMGVAASSVVALPRAYLKSYQPSGPWPTGRTIAQAASAVATRFCNGRTGVGMLTNFTEFNRHPPPIEPGEFVTYSTCAIVHAADDRSVFETLQALPHVHQSARAIAGERPLRLGLSSIGMRSNPYGAAVAENPNLERIAMATDDPRQRTVFGAAFAVGAYAAAAACGVARIACAGIGGPFATGAVENGRFVAWPIHHVVGALASMSSGRRVANPALEGSILGVQADLDGRRVGIFANCGLSESSLCMAGSLADQRAIIMSGDSDVTDPDWLAHADPVCAATIAVAPGSVVFTMQETV